MYSHFIPKYDLVATNTAGKYPKIYGLVASNMA